MKKILSLFLTLALFCSPLYAAWDDAAPAGTSLAADIDANVTGNNAAIEAILDEMRGYKNLRVTRTSATAVSVTADILFLQSSANIAAQESTVSEAIAITSSGASGLDTGSEASSTWYYIWIIRKSSDGTVNGLLSASASSPTMPADYDQKTLVSAVRNNGSSDFVDFEQYGDSYNYKASQLLGSGSVGASWVSIDVSSYVPSALSNYARGMLVWTSSAVTNDSSITSSTTPAPNKFAVVGSGNTGSYHWELDILTANTLYWNSSDGDSKIYLHGFTINKL